MDIQHVFMNFCSFCGNHDWADAEDATTKQEAYIFFDKEGWKEVETEQEIGCACPTCVRGMKQAGEIIKINGENIK